MEYSNDLGSIYIVLNLINNLEIQRIQESVCRLCANTWAFYTRDLSMHRLGVLWNPRTNPHGTKGQLYYLALLVRSPQCISRAPCITLEDLRENLLVCCLLYLLDGSLIPLFLTPSSIFKAVFCLSLTFLPPSREGTLWLPWPHLGI